MLAIPIDFYLVISRPTNQFEAAPTLEYEAKRLSEANAKIHELIKTYPDKTFKVETWTKVR